MKNLVIFSFVFVLAFPVFSQTAHQRRLNTLNDSMSTAVSRTNAKLEDFNSQIKDDGDIKLYTSFKRKFDSLMNAIQESENKLNLYLRTNERVSIIKDERDNYEKLFTQLKDIKNEYDNFMRRAQ